MGDVDVLWVDHLGFLDVSSSGARATRRGAVDRSESYDGGSTRAEREWLWRDCVVREWRVERSESVRGGKRADSLWIH
jgi:hypothetical protein